MGRKIGALWLKTSKDGKKYFSGVIETLNGDVHIAIFKNDKKEKENHPDYQIVVSDPMKKDGERTAAEAIAQGAETGTTDEIPF